MKENDFVLPEWFKQSEKRVRQINRRVNELIKEVKKNGFKQDTHSDDPGFIAIDTELNALFKEGQELSERQFDYLDELRSNRQE